MFRLAAIGDPDFLHPLTQRFTDIAISLPPQAAKFLRDKGFREIRAMVLSDSSAVSREYDNINLNVLIGNLSPVIVKEGMQFSIGADIRDASGRNTHKSINLFVYRDDGVDLFEHVRSFYSHPLLQGLEESIKVPADASVVLRNNFIHTVSNLSGNMNRQQRVRNLFNACRFALLGCDIKGDLPADFEDVVKGVFRLMNSEKCSKEERLSLCRQATNWLSFIWP